MDGYANEPAWRRMGNTYWRLRELKMTKVGWSFHEALRNTSDLQYPVRA